MATVFGRSAAGQTFELVTATVGRSAEEPVPTDAMVRVVLRRRELGSRKPSYLFRLHRL